jgi:prefoldin subunit 5
MFFRFAVAAALLALLISNAALGQQATVYDKTQDTRIDDLAKQLETLTNRVTTSENNIAAIDRRIEALTGNVEKLADAAKDIDARIRKLDERVSQSTDISKGELTTMRTQLDAISRKDGDSYVPNISAAMNTSDTFRQDMETAVNKSLKTGGSVLLTNKTAVSHWVAINQTRYFLRPGQQLPVAVNVGTVTTQLPGEEMQTWTITAPSYELSLDIVPKSTARTVALSPIYSPASPYFMPPLVEFIGATEVAYR